MRILLYSKSLLRFELGYGKMENIIITKSLKRKLDDVVLHEQVENGTAVNNNLNANQID